MAHSLQVTTALADVQKRVCDIVAAETLLVGHGLENDLVALRVLHANCIDTALLYPHPKVRLEEVGISSQWEGRHKAGFDMHLRSRQCIACSIRLQIVFLPGESVTAIGLRRNTR